MSSEKALYTHGHHQSVVRSHARRTAQNSMGFLLPEIKPTSRILDLGCGPGTITIGMAKLAYDGHVIGCDTSSSIIDQAQALAKDEGLSNVEFQQSDGNSLPFEDASFDIVFAHQVLQHVADPVAILKEMRRVCKGVVAARDADYLSFAWYPEHEKLSEWLGLYQKIAKANGAQPNAGRYLDAWARTAGFDRVEFTWDVWHYQGEDAIVFGRAWTDRVVHSAFATSAENHGLAKKEELEAISKGWTEWASSVEAEHGFIMIPNGQILCRF